MKVITPFRPHGLARQQITRAARAGSGPLKVLLRMFGKSLCEDRPTTDMSMRLLEEGTMEDSGLSDAYTETPDWPATQVQHEAPNVPQQAQESSSVPPSGFEPDGQLMVALEHSYSSSNDKGQGSGAELSTGTPEAAAVNQAPQLLLYPDEDRMALVDDTVAFLLTRETIKRLHQVILTSRSVQRYRQRFEVVKREANVGQSFVEISQSQVDDPKTPEALRIQIRQDLEERKPSILADIQRKVDMEHELGVRTCNLEYLREQSDEVFERIMADAGVTDTIPGLPDTETADSGAIEAYDTAIPVPDSVLHLESSYEALHGYAETSANDAFDPEDLEMDMAQQKHTQAWENLQLARELFDHRDAAYKMDVAENADGVEHSREEIDFFHVKQGAELTKNLREAEEEFERTQAQAKALNILVESVASRPETDGYCESQDPTQFAERVDRNYIEGWATEVPATQELPSPSQPSSVGLQTESVRMCDSCSACDASPRQRRRIDQWHEEQDRLRKMFE